MVCETRSEVRRAKWRGLCGSNRQKNSVRLGIPKSSQREALLKWIEASEKWNVWKWIGQLDPENESMKILQNVGNYWSNDCVTSQVYLIFSNTAVKDSNFVPYKRHKMRVSDFQKLLFCWSWYLLCSVIILHHRNATYLALSLSAAPLKNLLNTFNFSP